jgi:hypothetical protein
MSFASIDDLISEMSGGKNFRVDFMKTTSGIGTVVAGRWYDLTSFPGHPPAYIHGNLVSNYDFQSGPANWTVSSGFTWTSATHLMTKSNSGSTETLSQDIDCVAGASYEVIWTAGSYAGSGNISLSIGGGTAVTRAANGTFTETITAGSSNKTFLISCASTITALTVDLVYVRRLGHFTPYYNNGTGKDMVPYLGGDVSPDTKHIINIGAWANVAAGCPSVLLLCDFLGVYPKLSSQTGTSVTALYQNDHVSNGTFTGNANGWTLGSGWAYNSNAVDKSTGTGVLSQTTSTAPISGRTYNITYTISNFSVGGNLTIGFGGATTVRNITANGTYTDQVTASASSGDLTFTGVNGMTLTIDSITCGFGLPRYTDGKGVRPFLVVNTAPGTGANTYSLLYTNPEGTRGQNLGASCTTTASAIVSHLPISGVAAGNYGPFLPLAAAATGIMQAESYQWSASSGSAGFHDLVLVKPLVALPLTAAFYAAERDLLSQLPSLPQVKDGACLGFIIFAGAVIPNPCMYQGYLDLAWG